MTAVTVPLTPHDEHTLVAAESRGSVSEGLHHTLQVSDSHSAMLVEKLAQDTALPVSDRTEGLSGTPSEENATPRDEEEDIVSDMLCPPSRESPEPVVRTWSGLLPFDTERSLSL